MADSQRRILRDIADLREVINRLAGTPSAVTRMEAIHCLLEYGRRAERMLARSRKASAPHFEDETTQRMFDGLNPNEAKVLQALWGNALSATGGDFGFVEEIDHEALGVTREQLYAHMNALSAKRLFNWHDPESVNGEEVVEQFDFPYAVPGQPKRS